MTRVASERRERATGAERGAGVPASDGAGGSGALLYRVEPGDPATFVSVAVLLGVIALVAGYIPACRATRVDAIAALRAE